MKTNILDKPGNKRKGGSFFSIIFLICIVINLNASAIEQNKSLHENTIMQAEKLISGYGIAKIDSVERERIYFLLDSLDLQSYIIKLLDTEIKSNLLNNWQTIERRTQKAFVLFETGKYQQAKALFKKNLELKSKELEQFQMINYAGLANILFNQSELDSALQMVNNFYRLAMEQNDSTRIAESLKLRANILFTKADYRNALTQHIMAIDFGDSMSKANTYNEISRDYFYLQKFDSAFHFGRKSLRLKKEINDTYGYCSSLGNTGHLYYYTNQKDSAIEYFKKSLLLAENQSFTDLQAWMHKSLSDFYNKEKDIEKAFAHFKTYSKLNEELITKQSDVRFAIEKAKSNAVLQQNYTKHLENVNKIEKYKRNRLLFIVFIVSLISIVTILLILMSKLRTEKRILELRQRLSRIQMNPHFIFNSLNSLQRHILNGDIRASNKYLTKFSKLMRTTLENSTKEMIPIEMEINSIQNYIELEAIRFDNSFSHTINFSEKLDVAFLKMPSMILQPLIENAIWHGLLPSDAIEKKLTLNVIDGGDHIIFEVIDNGKGMTKTTSNNPADKSKKSMGLMITKSRLDDLSKLYGKKFTLKTEPAFDSQEYPGVNVKVEIPKLYRK